MVEWLRSAVTDYTPGVGRVFMACRNPQSGTGCGRIIPHYTLTQQVGCRYCGGLYIVPTRLPEWRAALWVLVVGLLWRKTIRGRADWDPRLPIRSAESKYA